MKRPQYVYCLVERGTGRIKIGISDHPYHRATVLDQEIDLDVSAQFSCAYPRVAERLLHKTFAAYHVEPALMGQGDGRTEWFDPVVGELVAEAIERLPARLQCGPITRIAREFSRVTLAIPASMHYRLRIEAVERNMTVNALANEIFEDYFKDWR